ncbi:MAG TPA: hypothetical protein VHG89_12390 [Verrucomicrobiae bacterium]|nr:hypothetical protein [Verrucomicrobiae bacterium]
MFRSKRERENHRFYLLPGMGGKAWHRKRNTILKWTFAVAILGATALSLLLYLINR